MTYEKLAYENGVFYVMEVTQVPNGQHTDYKCRGYARCNGIDLAEWVYWALDEEEAYQEMTRDYLLRELRPMARHALEVLSKAYQLQTA
jgi:hypothetical protein